MSWWFSSLVQEGFQTLVYVLSDSAVRVSAASLSKTFLVCFQNVDTDEKGHIIVDEYQNTSRAGIYAVGDVCGKALLTPGITLPLRNVKWLLWVPILKPLSLINAYSLLRCVQLRSLQAGSWPIDYLRAKRTPNWTTLQSPRWYSATLPLAQWD